MREFPKGKVKQKLYLYETEAYYEKPYFITTLPMDGYGYVYLGETEVEFDFPEIVSKDVRLAELDKALDQQKAQYEEAVKRIEEAKEKLEKME